MSPFTLAFPMEFLHFGIQGPPRVSVHPCLSYGILTLWHQGGAACLRSPLFLVWNSYILASKGGAACLRSPLLFLWNSYILASKGGAACLRSSLLYLWNPYQQATDTFWAIPQNLLACPATETMTETTLLMKPIIMVGVQRSAYH